MTVRIGLALLVLAACGDDSASRADAGVACGDGGYFLALTSELEGCTELVGHFHFSDNPQLDLTPLSSLREVSGSLTFFRNDELLDLGPLEKLERVSGTFQLRNHLKLRSLAALRSLRSVGELNITNNFALPQADVDTFAKRIQVAGESALEGNAP